MSETASKLASDVGFWDKDGVLPSKSLTKTSVFTASAIVTVVLSACAGAPRDATPEGSDQALQSLPSLGDAASADAGSDSGDGTPMRQACTSAFGNGLSGRFGRLDGILVSVVPAGHGACNADAHHVHLQVLVDGSVYDVAVNVDGGFFATKDMPLPGEPWSEGWHGTASLDYARDLGLSADEFTPGSEVEIASALEGALAQANHISVFASPYSHGGSHLVHRNGSRHDGAVVLDPLAPNAKLFAFRFSNQSF